MPKYVIHIGPPKTGSKYLQSHLFQARAELLRQGICYPDGWWAHDDEIMHQALLEQLRRGEAEAVQAQLRKLNEAGHRLVVLSCEGFDDLRMGELELLRAAIGDHPVEIVYYCRRWSELIPSVWRMRVMMGQFQTFPERYAFYFLDPSATGELNYSLVWKRFASVFGRQSLRLVSHAFLQKSGADLFAHFCKTFLELDRPPAVVRERVQHNVSPAMDEIEAMRALNYLHAAKTGRISPLMRIKFMALRGQMDIGPLAALMEGDVGECDIRNGAEAWKESWKAISTYEDCLVDKERAGHIFELSPRPTPFRYVRTNYLLKAGAQEMVSTLHRFLEEIPVANPQLRFA